MRTGALWVWLLSVLLTVSVSVAATAYYFGAGPFNRGRTRLVVSTTTSLYDTGLLDAIEERFEAQYPIDIYFISAGTGIAITYAQRGDADMILVHEPKSERAFLEGGYGVCRKIIAYNFFTVVGLQTDPAAIAGLTVTQSLERIVKAGRRGEALWVSRGDGSGTHAKEKELWAAAGFNWTDLRNEAWYVESGTGMGKTLQIANEKSAYTLADMGTYVKLYSDGLIDLKVIIEADRNLLNVYSAIAVNSSYNPEASFEAAITFIKFLTSEEGQRVFDQFGEDVYGQELFYPAVRLLSENSNSTLAGWIKEYAYFDGEECPGEYQNDHSEMYR